MPCYAPPDFRVLSVLRRADDLAFFSDLNKVFCFQSMMKQTDLIPHSGGSVGCRCILLNIHSSVLPLQCSVCVVHFERRVDVVVM